MSYKNIEKKSIYRKILNIESQNIEIKKYRKSHTIEFWKKHNFNYLTKLFNYYVVIGLFNLILNILFYIHITF